jgi:nucleotide-binding universal stress UspA family protein
MIVLKNVLVATDFGEASKVALDYGRDLARAYGATLHVLHVVEDLTYSYASEVGFALPGYQDEIVAQAQKAMDESLTADDRATLRVVPAVRTMRVPANAITEYAKEHAIDVIVVGTHGRGVVQHFLMGSVAERVVRTAPCPVLTVRAHERDFIAPDELQLAASAAR